MTAMVPSADSASDRPTDRDSGSDTGGDGQPANPSAAVPATKRFCVNCGAQLGSGRFCASCGTPAA